MAATTPGVGVTTVDYLGSAAADSSAAAAAVVAAAAYGNLNSMYPTAATYAPAAASAEPSLSPYIGHTGGYHHHHHQSLYSTPTLDNRYLTATENLFQYRPLGSYYPDYPTTTGYNGFIDVSSLPPTYESHQQLTAAVTPESPKYAYADARTATYSLESPLVARTGSRHSLEAASASSNSADSSPATHNNNGLAITPKIEDVKPDLYGGIETPRQTVLMWGAPPSRTPPRNNGSYSPPTTGNLFFTIES